jgi:hypothetical protein
MGGHHGRADAEDSDGGNVVVALPLSRRGGRARLLATAVLFGALLAGSALGDDVHFPFGPFRMYASTEALDGATSWYVLVGFGPDGVRHEIPTDKVGLRRAELEGRVAAIVAEPALLQGLVELYAVRHPSEPVTGMEIVRRTQPMEGGAPQGEAVDEVVVAWLP